MKIEKNIKYWQDLSPPLCPNEYEVELFRYHSRGYGPICLLGMTKNLQDICDFMVDIHPTKQKKPVINCDWNDLDVYAECILGDGVINLEGIQLVNKLLEKYNKIVCRVFLKKFPWMKYATHFPSKFPNANFVIPTQEDIAIVVWEK